MNMEMSMFYEKIFCELYPIPYRIRLKKSGRDRPDFLTFSPLSKGNFALLSRGFVKRVEKLRGFENGMDFVLRNAARTHGV